MAKKVMVIGAGPAGLAAAIELSKHGIKPVIFEQNRSGQIDQSGNTKLCAGGLIPISQKILGGLNCESNEIRSFIAKTRYCKSIVNLDYPVIINVDRNILIKELEKRAKSLGTQILHNIKITNLDLGNKTLMVGDKKYNYDYLIGADGAFSIVRKALIEQGKIRAGNKILQALEYQIDRNKFDHPLLVDFDYPILSGGYAWIFPHKKYLSIGACESMITRSKKDRKLSMDLNEWTHKNGIPFDKKSLRGWIIPYDLQKYSFGSIFLAGDAGGFTGGFLGEGISYALASGFDIANLIMDSKYRPVNIKRALKIKRLHETYLQAGDRFPLIRSWILHLMVYLAGKKAFQVIPLRLFDLYKIK